MGLCRVRLARRMNPILRKVLALTLFLYGAYIYSDWIYKTAFLDGLNKGLNVNIIKPPKQPADFERFSTPHPVFEKDHCYSA